jgi:cytochrome P450 family 104
MPALMPKTIESVWAPLYAKLAAAYLDRLPRGEVVDLFPALAGPLAARILAHAMGVPNVTDEAMQRWSQTLIDGAGNFGWMPGPFDATDIANAEMDKCIRANAERVRAESDFSALSIMVNAKNPIPESQMIANVKIAIGGGINEPRDALLTILYGLLTNPDQLDAVRASVWNGGDLEDESPPVGEITEKTEEDSRSNRRPIALMGSPACQRSQISDR